MSAIFIVKGQDFRFYSKHFLSCSVSVTFVDYWSLCTIWAWPQFFKMLLSSNRIKICSLAFTAARLYSNGPTTANKNPTVYFDIAADSQPLGRVTFEVGRQLKPQGGICSDAVLFPFFFLTRDSLFVVLSLSSTCVLACFLNTLITFIFLFAAQRWCCAKNCR